MVRYMKMTFAVLIMFAGVASVSAAPRGVIHNERGTFIQDSSGMWHQYNRIPRVSAPPAAMENEALDHAKGGIY
jgi:hypothetical protein